MHLVILGADVDKIENAMARVCNIFAASKNV